MKQVRDPRTTAIAITITVVSVLVLCGVSFVIARPFFAALLWGMIVAIATWSAFTGLRRRLGGHNTVAAALMTALLALVLLGPLVVIGAVMSDNVVVLGERLRAAIQGGLEPPDFMANIPLFGESLTRRWHELVADGELSTEARQVLRIAIQWLLGLGAALGGGIAQLALSIFCAFFFYRDGEAALSRLRDILAHVAGAKALHLLSVAYGTLKGVVYGVLGAAMAQAALAILGFWLAGVPAPFLLGLAVGFFGIIPGGPTLIWLPAAIWLFRSGETGWGLFLIAWSAALVNNIDNVIRPLFISRGSALPLLLILIGILGGAIALGFIGIFLGPTILAVLYAMMREWSPGDYGQPVVEEPVAGEPVVAEIAADQPPAVT